MSRRPSPPRTRVTLAAASLALAGCGLEQPEPEITAFSGTDYYLAEPACWAQEGPVPQDELAQCEQAEEAPTVAVLPGNVVGIALPPEVGERGWVPVLDGQPLATEPLTGSYFRFTPSEEQLRAEGRLQIVAFTEEGSEEVRGVWPLTLTRESGLT